MVGRLVNDSLIVKSVPYKISKNTKSTRAREIHSSFLGIEDVWGLYRAHDFNHFSYRKHGRSSGVKGTDILGVHFPYSKDMDWWEDLLA